MERNSAKLGDGPEIRACYCLRYSTAGMFFVLRRTKRNGCLHREIAEWRKDVNHLPVSWIAVSTSSMVEKTVPISLAAVSIPIFAIGFNNISLEIERRSCCPSTNSTRPLRARITDKDRSVQCIDHETGGMVCRSA